MNRCAKAFTLVELLVVIAVISILAAMLMPALEKALVESRKSVCAGNLRQFGLYNSMYADEFSGVLPRGTSWPLFHNTTIATSNMDGYSEQTCLMRAGYLQSYDIAWCPSRVSYEASALWTNTYYSYSRLFRTYYPTGNGNIQSTYAFRYHIDNATFVLNLHKDMRVAKLPIMWDYLGKYGSGTLLYHNDPDGYNRLYGGGHVRWLNDTNYATGITLGGIVPSYSLRDYFVWNMLDKK